MKKWILNRIAKNSIEHVKIPSNYKTQNIYNTNALRLWHSILFFS